MTAWAEPRPSAAGPLPAQAITLLQYRRARAALGDAPETAAIAAALEATATQHPHSGIAVPGTAVRILRANRYGGYPPMRLYYCVAPAAVHFLWIEHYDEMEP